jgi:GNAT superfamily N-acetyltransferase
MEVVPTPPRPPLLARLWGRLRHGLLMQEILDRMHAGGVIVMPYYVTTESSVDLPDVYVPHGYHIRELGPDDTAAIVAISVRPRTVAQTHEAFRRMRCYGVLRGDELAGHTWISFTHVPVPSAATVLFALQPDEAYLLDMYIAPSHRGARLAPWLRAHVLRSLAAENRPHCYSISLYFNRSSRRFKARLGAQERELRIYLQLSAGNLRGVDLRLKAWGPMLRTPARKAIAGERERQP